VSRAERLAGAAGERELDQLLVGDLVRPGDSDRRGMANLRYLTRFTGTSGLCLVGETVGSGDEPGVFFTDFRYTERAQREVGAEFERATAESQLLPALAERLAGRVGYDDANTSVRNLRKLEEVAPDGVELVPAAGLVEELRRAKDFDELASIAEAQRLTDEVYEWMTGQGLVGRKERDIVCASWAPRARRSRRSSPRARTARSRTRRPASARSAPASWW
jgi:Xaa-Pro aminopeptidase